MANSRHFALVHTKRKISSQIRQIYWS